MTAPTLFNERRPSDTIWTAGAVAPEQFGELKAAGVKRVINLRPRAEQGEFDESATVSACGMQYANLPIAGPQDLTLANVKAFDALMAEAGDDSTVVHCASNNRVGALFALRAAWIKGVSADEALAIGRAHGLLAMEPAVAALLAQGPA